MTILLPTEVAGCRIGDEIALRIPALWIYSPQA